MSTNFQCKACDSDKPEESLLLCHGACKRQLHAICAGIKIAKTATTVHAFLQQNRNNFKFVCIDCADLDSSRLLDAIKSLDSKILLIEQQNEKFAQHEVLLKEQQESLSRIESELKKCLNNTNGSFSRPFQPNLLINPFSSNQETIGFKRQRPRSEVLQEEKSPKAIKLMKKKKKASKPSNTPITSNEQIISQQKSNKNPTTSYRDAVFTAPTSIAATTKDVTTTHELEGVQLPKYMYVTRLQTTTTESKLKQFILHKFGIALKNIECKLLVSAGTDITTLNYISYRVLVPASDYNRLLQKSEWPANIICRPFKEISRASQNFRLKPRQTYSI